MHPANDGLPQREWAHAVALGGATLLLPDLLLNWHGTTVRMARGVDLHATSNGWQGWGGVVGVLATALLVLELGRRRDRRERATASIAASLGALVAATFAVFTDRADVAIATVGVRVYSTSWPAWLGLALAVLIAGATLTAYGAFRARPSDVGAPTPQAP